MEQFGAHTKAAGNNRAALRRAAAARAALTQPPRQPAPLVHEVTHHDNIGRPALAMRMGAAHRNAAPAVVHAGARLLHRRPALAALYRATFAPVCTVMRVAALYHRTLTDDF